jgi:hypothetical protein
MNQKGQTSMEVLLLILVILAVSLSHISSFSQASDNVQLNLISRDEIVKFSVLSEKNFVVLKVIHSFDTSLTNLDIKVKTSPSSLTFDSFSLSEQSDLNKIKDLIKSKSNLNSVDISFN